jgi:hypothetical protein
MVSAEVLAGHVDRLRESFWPDDAWAVVPPRSAKEMEETRLQAQVWPLPGEIRLAALPHFMILFQPQACITSTISTSWSIHPYMPYTQEREWILFGV